MSDWALDRSMAQATQSDKHFTLYQQFRQAINDKLPSAGNLNGNPFLQATACVIPL